MALINKEDLIKDIQKNVCELCGEYTKYNGAMCRACRVEDVIDIIDYFEDAEPAAAGSVMSIKEIMKAAGMTQKAFCELFGIPRRTVEDWSRGARVCPEYVRKMIIELLEL